jgi:hypothetical protein
MSSTSFNVALQDPHSNINRFAIETHGRCEETLDGIRCDLSTRHPAYHETKEGLSWAYDMDGNVESNR